MFEFIPGFFMVLGVLFSIKAGHLMRYGENSTRVEIKMSVICLLIAGFSFGFFILSHLDWLLNFFFPAGFVVFSFLGGALGQGLIMFHTALFVLAVCFALPLFTARLSATFYQRRFKNVPK